ncbi:hypothetical protein G7Z17_g2944 [Cylindrodendrum hubeiense]|uniref:Xylanolytic transcriptional activator regulatory domain-containing protein n=1 Tax=Cylindrodendrum hubeiense TaxID=595255 RepID=A0A9P5LIK6_9HYPO|nr:hypothetical protein G7Z17_g2944 [Cylindrodendrum hubeiense]
MRRLCTTRPLAKSQQTRQRIARLENLVTEMRDMVQSSHQPSGEIALPSETLSNPGPSLARPDGRVTDDMGKLNLTDDHAVYTGSSHWVTILEDIQCLKDEVSEEYSSNTSLELTLFESFDADVHGSPAIRTSLLSSAPSLTREQILDMIPPRKVVDRHVSHFFNAFDMAPFLLHRSKFLAEYANFWSNPSATPIMWIGLLCSVMTMSAFLQQQDVVALGMPTAESQDMLENYRTLTIHCLVAGDYLQPGRYTIETLTLHFGVDQNVNLDASISNWVLIGVVIRIALRVGLHRDPSHWPGIRPLQAELRRRLWMTLYQMDFFTSTQLGLPRIIKDSQSDTRPPAHLFADDIGFEHDQIPPERPLTGPTPLLYVIQRHKIIQVSAEIYDATEAGPPTSDTSAVLAAKLERAIDAIPSWLKYSSLETSIADNPATILHQMFLDILIHKATYLLHRRSFVKGSVGEDSTKSNQLCINAALAILEHQRRISEETKPGGLVFGIRWKVATSLSHEFLQATMMLCFALSRFNGGHDSTTNSCAAHRRGDIFEALTLARSLWEKNADRSIEAQKAVKAITTVLQQDLDRSSAPSVAASDGFFDPMIGVDAQNYIGSFDYGQNMALDPSFLAVDDDVGAFGTILDDFVTEQSNM